MKKFIFPVVLLLICNYSLATTYPIKKDKKDNAKVNSEMFGITNGAFYLINSLDDTVTSTITDGATYDLNVIGDKLNIQAVPTASYTHIKFSSSDGYSKTEGVAPYAYKGDVSGNYNDWTPAVGSLTFTVEYINSGTTINTDTFTITFVQNTGDTMAPTAPTSLAANPIAQTSLTLTWSPSTDNVAVTDYEVFKDGTSLGLTGGATTYAVTGLTASTSYDFKLTAKDAAGNTSADSAQFTVTTASPGGGGTGGHWTQNGTIVHYNTGNVGIGTTTPGTWKLAVNGKVRAKEIKVETANWPDYVFTKRYSLPTLEEVANHIDEKGYLINMPSARDVEANGIELGEMNRLLLEKIEELTLYVIALKKEIDSIKEKE